MLSLVHGPVDIVPGDPHLKPDKIVVASTQWDDQRGLYILNSYNSSGSGNPDQFWFSIFIAHLDGLAYHVGHLGWANTLAWSAGDSLVVTGYNNSWEKVRLPALNRIGPGHGGNSGSGVMPDRKLMPSAYFIMKANLENYFGSQEYAFPSPFAWGGGGQRLVYAGRKNGKYLWWSVDYVAGRFYKYNATDKTEATDYVRSGFGAAIKECAYSPKHDLFFVIRANPVVGEPDQLFVYANEVEASQVTAPVVTPAARRGGMSKITARVLGSYGEACEGRNVRFEVNGGTVEPSVVATDKTGTATSYFYAPTGSAGDVEATAVLEE